MEAGNSNCQFEKEYLIYFTEEVPIRGTRKGYEVFFYGQGRMQGKNLVGGLS